MKTVCTILNVNENTHKENIDIDLIRNDNVLAMHLGNEMICLLWSDIEKLKYNKKENLTRIVQEFSIIMMRITPIIIGQSLMKPAE